MNRYSGWKPNPFAFQRGVLGPRPQGQPSVGMAPIIDKAKQSGHATEEDIAAICHALQPRRSGMYDACAAACCAAMLEVKPEHRPLLEQKLLEALHYLQHPGDERFASAPMEEAANPGRSPQSARPSPAKTIIAYLLLGIGSLSVLKLLPLIMVKAVPGAAVKVEDVIIPVLCIVLGALLLNVRAPELPAVYDWTNQLPECIVRALERVGGTASITPLLDVKRGAAYCPSDVCSRAIANLLTIPRSDSFSLDSTKYTSVICSALLNAPPRYRLAILDALGQYGNASALSAIAPFVGPGQKPEIIDAAHRAQAAIQIREKMTKDARNLLRPSDAPDSLLRPAELPDDTLLRPAGSTTRPEQQLLRPAGE